MLLFEGERLINHVIESAGVVDKDFCELKCYMEHNCVSINFELKPGSSGTHNCELNNSIHKENERDLVKAANYLYHGTNVRLKKLQYRSIVFRPYVFLDKSSFTAIH